MTKRPYRCLVCEEVKEPEEIEVIEVSPAQQRLECGDCGETKFEMIGEPPREPSMDQVREQKRQAKVRSLERGRRR